MKNLVFVIAVAALGCKKTKAADCETAINHSMELATPDLVKMGADQKALATMRELGLKHCTTDGWADEARTCMALATSKEEAQGCYGKLTKAQQQIVNDEAKAMQPSAPTPPPPATPK